MKERLGAAWRRYRGWPTWVQIVIAVFVGLIAIGLAFGESPDETAVRTRGTTSTVEVTKTERATTTTERTTTTAEAGPTTTRPPAAPKWSEGAPLTEDNVRAALRSAKEMGRSENLGKPRAVAVDAGGGAVTVTYKPETAWDEKDLLKIGAQTSFSGHRALFANPAVQRVSVVLVGDWTDQYGKATEDVSTRIDLLRSTVDEKIDWRGLEDRVLLDSKNMFCISDSYYIHPAIYRTIEGRECLRTHER